MNQDEHFIVWMRVAALPHFRKLWGKIGQSLKKGDVITVNLQNLYNTYSFDGQKKLVGRASSFRSDPFRSTFYAYVLSV